MNACVLNVTLVTMAVQMCFFVYMRVTGVLVCVKTKQKSIAAGKICESMRVLSTFGLFLFNKRNYHLKEN